MPSYKVHLLGGAATYGLVTTIVSFIAPASVPWSYQGAMLGFALLGSIFPDIDIASRIQIIFFRIMFVALPLLLFFQYFITFVCMAALCLSLIIIKHRTLTHRTWFLLLLTSTGVGLVILKHPTYTTLASTAGIQFFVGSISHLILDRAVNKWKLRKY